MMDCDTKQMTFEVTEDLMIRYEWCLSIVHWVMMMVMIDET